MKATEKKNFNNWRKIIVVVTNYCILLWTVVFVMLQTNKWFGHLLGFSTKKHLFNMIIQKQIAITKKEVLLNASWKFKSGKYAFIQISK